MSQLSRDAAASRIQYDEDAFTLENVDSPPPLPRPAQPGPGTLRLVALGGLGEIGMNCLAIEQDTGIVLIDCGVTFPTNDLGIDVFHPRFDYVLARSDRLLGVVLTHGHEDHIGGLPYLLAAFDVPVYGPAHAIELARQRLTEHGFDLGDVALNVTQIGRSFDLGPFAFEPIRVTHSITDATALAIRTAAGTVIHTGDFKFDPAPPDGELTDEARLRAIGDEGVRLLLSDSTNIDAPGTSTSESDVGEALSELVAKAKARVVLGVFASNVQRLRMIGDVAVATKRSICLLGRSIITHTRVAQAVGRIRWPSDLIVPPEVAATMPRERILIVASGTQAERMSSLTRLAAGTHPSLRLDEGDLVILSSRIIPGNDRPVFDMMASFLRLGVELVTRITDRRVHASGHAHRDEQLRMIELTRPRAFVPVHGTLHHLMRHAALARDAGVDEVLVVENGEPIELGPDTAPVKTGRVPVGKVATFGGDEVPEEVLRERAQLGRSGVAFVSVVVDRRGVLAGAPQVVARGVVDVSFSSALRKTAGAVARAVADCDPRARSADGELASVVRLAARRAIESQTGRRPLVVVSVTRI
jgi:ribonuclease J